MRSMERIKQSIATMALLGSVALTAMPASAQVSGGIYVNFGHPPEPVYEAVPVAPGPGYAWHRGAWGWDGHRYRWHKGYYENRGRHGEGRGHDDHRDHGDDHRDH